MDSQGLGHLNETYAYSLLPPAGLFLNFLFLQGGGIHSGYFQEAFVFEFLALDSY